MTEKDDLIPIDLNESVFTLSDMIGCWENSRLSFSKEIGNDMSDEVEAGYKIYPSFNAYLKGNYHMKKREQ